MLPGSFVVDAVILRNVLADSFVVMSATKITVTFGGLLPVQADYAGACPSTFAGDWYPRV